MKVKRIVSILLTGSMLLSLLPVSALAATPVFDAPAQTTAKKAAPLVQEHPRAALQTPMRLASK